MIIELRPKIFTKEWYKWFNNKLWGCVFDEVEKQETELEKSLANWRCNRSQSIINKKEVAIRKD